ncbi:hypothetical protein ACTXT7_004273 [Hymenolepis weldensis]
MADVSHVLSSVSRRDNRHLYWYLCANAQAQSGTVCGTIEEILSSVNDFQSPGFDRHLLAIANTFTHSKGDPMTSNPSEISGPLDEMKFVKRDILGKTIIKLENYNNVYQQNNLPPQYSDYPKDANGHQPKPEPPLKFSSELLAPAIPISTQPSPMMQGYIPEINSCIPMLIPSTTCGPNNSISGSSKSDFRKSDGMVSQKNDYCFNDNASISPALSSTEPSFRKYQCLDGSVNLAQSGQPNSEKPQQSSAPPQTQSAFVTPPRTSSTVSEALFVQIIVSRCKRIAPLWFRGISSMRERNREENRRTSTNSGQTQSDWSIIAGKIRRKHQLMKYSITCGIIQSQEEVAILSKNTELESVWQYKVRLISTILNKNPWPSTLQLQKKWKWVAKLGNLGPETNNFCITQVAVGSALPKRPWLINIFMFYLIFSPSSTKQEMNQIMETDTVVNLLKKLHKELQADSVLKFIKCWLGDPEALNDPDSCVLSRPDAKGRMRRIDGGKGSDKTLGTVSRELER